MSVDITEAAIATPFIELDKLLKRENVADSGSEARHLVAAGLVKVNGETESRKRRKLYPGDVVEAEGRVLRVAAVKWDLQEGQPKDLSKNCLSTNRAM